MGINFEGFLASLPVMFYGMLGIFSVTAVIIIVIYLLNYVGNQKQ